MSLNRRQFIQAGMTAGLGALALGTVGCSPSKSKDREGDKSSAVTNPDEVVECDIVIVGGGMSGLAAACQAGENGDKAVIK